MSLPLALVGEPVAGEPVANSGAYPGAPGCAAGNTCLWHGHVMQCIFHPCANTSAISAVNPCAVSTMGWLATSHETHAFASIAAMRMAPILVDGGSSVHTTNLSITIAVQTTARHTIAENVYNAFCSAHLLFFRNSGSLLQHSEPFVPTTCPCMRRTGCCSPCNIVLPTMPRVPRHLVLPYCK